MKVNPTRTRLAAKKQKSTLPERKNIYPTLYESRVRSGWSKSGLPDPIRRYRTPDQAWPKFSKNNPDPSPKKICKRVSLSSGFGTVQTFNSNYHFGPLSGICHALPAIPLPPPLRAGKLWLRPYVKNKINYYFGISQKPRAQIKDITPSL